MNGNKITIETEKSTLHIDNVLSITSESPAAYISVSKDFLTDTIDINGIVLSSQQVEMLVKFLIS